MRMRGEVLEVTIDGCKLKVKLQAVGTTDAAWRPMNVITFECPDCPRILPRALHGVAA